MEQGDWPVPRGPPSLLRPLWSPPGGCAPTAQRTPTALLADPPAWFTPSGFSSLSPRATVTSFLVGTQTFISPKPGGITCWLRPADSFLVAGRKICFSPRDTVPLGGPSAWDGGPCCIALHVQTPHARDEAAALLPGQAKPVQAVSRAPAERRYPVCRESVLIPRISSPLYGGKTDN